MKNQPFACSISLSRSSHSSLFRYAMGAALLVSPVEAAVVSGINVAVSHQMAPNTYSTRLIQDGQHGTANANTSYNWKYLNPCPACPGDGSPGVDNSYRWYQGEAWVTGDFSGATGLPVLKAYTESWVDSSVPGDIFPIWTQADALQKYTYQGPSTTKTLQINLHATVTGTDSGWGGANLSVYILNYNSFSSGFSWAYNPGDPSMDWLSLISAGTLAENGAMAMGELFAGNPTNATTTLSFDVQNGDEFFVFARLHVG
ncbi:MAG: hypothetical protein EOP85_14070, partial [Verrucomicrobiaceae bacterium]